MSPSGFLLFNFYFLIFNMTHFKMTSIAVAVALLFAACQSKNAKQENGQQQVDTASSQAMASSNIPKTNNEAINALYPHYVTLQKALVAADETQVKEAALLVEEASKQVNEATSLQATATALFMAPTLEEQRAAFAHLSDELISLIKATGVQDGEFYLAHCPMAANDQGANWISPTKSIQNPYFGDKMLTCGSITETLK